MGRSTFVTRATLRVKLTYLAEESALTSLIGERASKNGRIGRPDTNNQMTERAAGVSYQVATGVEIVSISIGNKRCKK